MTTPSYDVAGFRGYFDEFTEALYDDNKVNRALREGNVLSGRLGVETKLYCAAHLLTLRSEMTRDRDGRPTPDGGSGVVLSETIGPRMVSYNTAEGKEFYNRTWYGRMFLEMIKTSPRRHMPMIVG